MRIGAFTAGDIVDDKYEIVDKIGSGGYGTVLRVKSIEDGQFLAMKYCIADTSSDDFRRFIKEIDTLEPLYLENVIRILDSELHAPVPYYIMPLAEGSLEDTVSNLRDSESDLLNSFKQICIGIRQLHDKKIIHRDIKPLNILIVGGVPHVADFGLAKVLTTTTTGETTSFLGTLEYAAPEQFSVDGAKSVDARSDIFSLGKLLYWLYTGRSPSHMEIGRLPEKMKPIVERSTRVDKQDRYQTVSSLLDVIEYYEKSLSFVDSATVAVSAGRTPKTLSDQISNVIHAVSQNRPDSAPKIRRFMVDFFKEVNALTPDFKDRSTEPDEALVKSIDDSLSLVTDFCYVADHVSQMNSVEDAEALFQSFESLLKGYDLPVGFSGSFNDYFFDFSKFVGHELFVSFVALLMRDERWEILTAILENLLCLESGTRVDEKIVDYKYINQGSILLLRRNDRLKLGRLSLHADILHRRHVEGELGNLVPSSVLSDADYFLYLRSIANQLKSETIDLWHAWIPKSILFSSSGVPRFLRYAKSKKYASKLLRPLSLSSIQDLRDQVTNHGRSIERAYSLGHWTSPVAMFDASTIGTL